MMFSEKTLSQAGLLSQTIFQVDDLVDVVRSRLITLGAEALHPVTQR
jgi:hypothetical protein